MANCDRAALLIFLAVEVKLAAEHPTGPSTEFVHRQVLVLFQIGTFGPPEGPDNLVDCTASLNLSAPSIVANQMMCVREVPVGRSAPLLHHLAAMTTVWKRSVARIASLNGRVGCSDRKTFYRARRPLRARPTFRLLRHPVSNLPR
jgi:hypothetical protein